MKKALIDAIVRIKGVGIDEAVRIIRIAADQWDKEQAAIRAAKEGR